MVKELFFNYQLYILHFQLTEKKGGARYWQGNIMRIVDEENS